MIKIELQFTTVAEAVAFLAAGHAATGAAPAVVTEKPDTQQAPKKSNTAAKTAAEGANKAQPFPSELTEVEPGVFAVRQVTNPGAHPHVGEFWGDFYVVDGVEIDAGNCNTESRATALKKARALVKATEPAKVKADPTPATTPVATPAASSPTAVAAAAAVPETKALDYAVDVGPKIAMAAKVNRPAVVAALAKLGVVKGTELKPEQWPAFVEAMDAILAG